MRYPKLKDFNLHFSIGAQLTELGWSPEVLIPQCSCGGAKNICWKHVSTSRIPGYYASEAEAFRVAHLFAYTNASGDRLALSALNWRHGSH